MNKFRNNKSPVMIEELIRQRLVGMNFFICPLKIIIKDTAKKRKFIIAGVDVLMWIDTI